MSIGYHYCRKKYHSGEYNAQKRKRSDEKNVEPGSGSYKALGDNIFNNSTTLPTTRNGQENTTLIQVDEQSREKGASSTSETKPLLSSSEEPSSPSANSEIEISDNQMADKNCQSNQSKTKEAQTPPPRTHVAQQEQVKVDVQPSTELNMNNNGLQDVQCAKANEVAEPQKSLMSQEQLNSKFNEILAIIPSDEQSGKAESKQPSLGKKANTLLQAIKIENAAQQIPSCALGNT